MKRFFDSDIDVNELNVYGDPPIDSQRSSVQKELDKNNIKTSDREDLVMQLERLASLKERGLLTNKEFTEAKRKILF